MIDTLEHIIKIERFEVKGVDIVTLRTESTNNVFIEYGH